MPVTISATRSTALHTDNDGDGYVEAGDVLRHTLTITNSGDTDALNVTVNDTLVGSTETGLMNISPIAFNDSFTAVGNTTLRVGGAANIGTGPSSQVAANLLTNDVGAVPGDDFPGFTLTAVTNGASTHGTYNIFTDGSFNYIANAGYTGTDTFTYTIHDVGIDGTEGTLDDTSSTATVTITIANKVWYVDNTAAAGGDGTSWHPFDSLSDVTGATGPDAAGEIIYVASGSGNYDGGITLLNNQELHGAGTALSVGGFNLAGAGTDPTIVNTGATNGTNGVVLASGNTLTGFTVGNTGGYDIANTTTATVGSLTVSNVDLTGTGGLFRADSGGALNVVFDTGSTSSVAGQGIWLTNTTGSFTVNGTGTIAGVTGTNVLISGGSAAVSIASNLTSNAGFAVSINGHTGTNNITFSGDLNVTGGAGLSIQNNSGAKTIAFTNPDADTQTISTGANAAVSLINNTGVTVSFTGGNLDIDTTTGAAFAASGGGILTVQGSNNSITTTTGTALDLSGMTVGTGGVTFATVNTNGAANGVLIATVGQQAGSTGIDINGGAVVNASTRGVDIDATSADVHVAATISTTAAGRSVEVTNSGATGGGNLIDFTGAIDDNGLGINLDNNDQNSGATVTFTGGLDIDTTTSAGFTAINGGRVNVTGGNNSIVSTSATALNVNGTTIGSSGLTFHDISSGNNTAAADPVNGILLANTGTSGGLTVTGDGGGANNGSGGTIQHATGDGINLTSTQDVHLGYMNITGNLGDGIGGSTVNGFVINRMNVTLNGDDAAADESGINLAELTGTAAAGLHPTSISNSVFTNNEEFQVQITNTSGTLTDFQYTNNTTSADGSSGTIGNLVNFLGLGTANMAITTTGGTYTGAAPLTATGLNIDHSGTSGTMTATVNGGTFTNNNVAVTMSVAQGGNIDFDIIGVTATGNRSHGLNLFVAASSTGTVTGSFLNNIIGTAGVSASGSDAGFGIRVQNEGSVATPNPVTVLISGNTVREILNFSAININQGIAGQALSRTTNATIINNTISDVDNGRAIVFQQNNSTNGTSAGVANLDIHGNILSLATIAGQVGDGTVIRIRQLDANGGDVNVVQTQATAAAIGTELDDANGFNNAAKISVSGSVDYGQPGPPLPLLLGGDHQLYLWDNDPRNSPDGTPAPVENTPPAGEGGGDPVVPPTPDSGPIVVDDGVLSQAELTLIVNAAIDRWAAAGASAEELAAMRAVTVTVEDLAGRFVGSSEAGHISLDSDAAGARWFIDATPDDDSEFTADGADLHGNSAAAADHVDLLTVVMHELGHQIGLVDSYAPGDDGQLMDGTISAGHRRLPGSDEVAQATGTSAAGDLALTQVNLGTVPAGRTVTIQWDSTVDTFINQLVPSYVNHSTVSWTNPPGSTFNSNNETLSTSSALALDSLVLGGTVWNDNGAGGGIVSNGIKDGTEPGINGVLVSLLVDANNDNVPDSLVAIATTLTAGGGLYSFAGLAPGNYIVRIDQDNFDAGGNTSLVATPISPTTSPEPIDPDNDADNDDNGSRTIGQPAFSNTITLAQNTEPTQDASLHNDINNTLDFGFFAPDQEPTLTATPLNPTYAEDSAAADLFSTVTASTVEAGQTFTAMRIDILGVTDGAAEILTFDGSDVALTNGTNVTTATNGLNVSVSVAAGTVSVSFSGAGLNAAQLQTLVDGLAYRNTSQVPTDANRTITIAQLVDSGSNVSPNDNIANPNLTSTVNVDPVNDTPVLVVATPVASTEQVFAAIDATATVHDGDLDLRNSGNGDYGGSTLTVARQGGANPDDLFQFASSGSFTVNGGNLEAAGNLVFASFTSSGGTLTVNFNDSATTATTNLVNAVLDAIQYANNNDVPPAAIDLTVSLNDGAPANAGQGSVAGHPATGTATVHVTITNTPENQPPVIDLDGGGGAIDNTANYTENAVPVILASGVDVNDVDDTDIESATVSVGTGFLSGFDYLTVNGGTSGTISGINFNYVAGTGVLTLTGTASLATYESVLAQIGFESTSNTPGTSRTIDWTVNDGIVDSTAAHTVVTITEVNDEPTLTATGTDPTFTEDGAAVDLFGTVSASTIEPGQTLTSLTLTVSNVTDGASEILSIDGSNVALTDLNSVVTAGHTLTVNVTVSSNIATVSFSGALLSESQLATLVDGLAYSNTSQNPTDADRVVTITQLVDSGAVGGLDDNTSAPNISSTVNVDPTNDDAVITGDTTGSVTEAGGVANGTPGTQTASGDLDSTDIDGNDDVWQAVSAGAGTTGGYGTYELAADGNWTYTLDDDNASVQALNGAATLSDTFDAVTEDGTTQTVTITIHAQDDKAVITAGGDTTGDVTEAGGVANGTAGTPSDTGNFDTTDVDDTDDVWQLVGAGTASDSGYGTYAVTAAGAWTYTLDDSDPAVQALNGATTLTDTFDVTTADGTAQQVTITIHAQNDAAVVTGDTTGDVTEAGGVNNGTPGVPTDTGDLDSTDVDNSNDAWQAVAAGTASIGGYGSYGLAADGKWTYTLDDNNASVQALNGAATLLDTFHALTADGTSQTVTITIHAQDDAPVAKNDAVTTNEATTLNGSVFADNGSGPDTDVDNLMPAVSAVNGSGAAVNNQITLPSGAFLTVHVDGTFSYNPNGVFDFTPTGSSGAFNTPQHDSFTYTLSGGNTATVSVTITGLDTNDILDGIGPDAIMSGGTGNDIYLVDSQNDQAIEAVGQGADIVFSKVSYTLSPTSEVETLSTFTWQLTTPIDLTGNGINNYIIGNDGMNIIDGGGGADIMVGRNGNDAYVVDNIGDIVFETAGQGANDVVVSKISYSLIDAYEVETLSTFDWAATTAIDLTGNNLNNYVIGNAGANHLDGKSGADILVGLGGDDVYYVDNAGDNVFESVGGGNDIVFATASHTLRPDAEVETLSTLDWSGTTAINLTGNGFANYLIGNAGANLLDGGDGNDALVGRGGADIFAFTTALGANNVDHIGDFLSGTDKISLDDAIFTQLAHNPILPSEPLPASVFHVGTAATDEDQRIIYDDVTGNLYYDADGNGGGAAVLFAVIDGHPPIVAADFIVT